MEYMKTISRVARSIKETDIKVLYSNLMGTGFLFIFGSSTINQIVSFAYSIIIVRLIPKANYGVYSYAFTIYSFFILLSGFGIVQAIVQIGSENADNDEKITDLVQYGTNSGVKINCLLSVLILSTALFIRLPIQGSNTLLGLLFLLPILSVIKDIQKTSLRIRFRNKEFAKANTVDTILITFFTILGALVFQEKGMILSQYAAAALIILLLWKTSGVPNLRKTTQVSQKEKIDIWKISGISMLNSGLSLLLPLVGTFILGIISADENMIASYRVASVIPTALNFIPSALMVYAYPYFAKHKDERAWVIKHYSLLVSSACALLLIITLGGQIFARQIISIIFGSQYAEAIVPFRILMISFFVNGTFNIIPGNLLVTQRRLKINLLTGITGTIISILANFLLIPRFASEGAAISQLLSVGVTGAMLTLWFIHIIRSIKPGLSQQT